MDIQAFGQYLRQTREAKEITLDAAENALRIRRRILESFELGDFNIPDSSPIQIRGFIRNYARFLGLDEDGTVEMYEVALDETLRPARLSGRRLDRAKAKPGKRDTQPVPAANPAPNGRSTNGAGRRTATNEMPPSSSLINTRPRRGTNWLTVLVVLMVGVAAVSVIAFVILQATGALEDTPFVPDQNSPPVIGFSSPEFTPSPTIQVVLLPTSVADVPFTGDGVLVQIQFEQRAWIRLNVDGVEQYVGLVRPGTVMEYSSSDRITLTTSNAEALNVTWNGQTQPLLGQRGQMVDVVFTREGVQVSSGPGFEPTPIQSNTPLPTPTDPAGAIIAQLTPTGTPGPSPTASDTPVPTDTPSITPTPSNTPTPSDTPTITPIPSTTPLPTDTPTNTLTPSATYTPTVTNTPTNTTVPTATAILPPRQTPVDVTPTKAGS